MRPKLILLGKVKLIGLHGESIHLTASCWRLLACLSVYSAPVARSVLKDMLWTRGTLGTLRKLIWDLNSVCKENQYELLTVNENSIDLSASIFCDVRELVRNDDNHNLYDLYKGDFIEGFVHDDQNWVAWASYQRHRLRELYISRAMTRLRDPYLDGETLSKEAEHLLGVDPTNQTAVRAQMLANARLGDTEAIRHNYHSLRSLLADGGILPEEATTSLFFRLANSNSAQSDKKDVQGSSDTPIVCILGPQGSKKSKLPRLAQSLITDVTIGLCRLSLFKILAPHTARRILEQDKKSETDRFHIDYLITTELIDHVFGSNQIVFSLCEKLTGRLLWSDRVENSESVTVENYNVLTSGIVQSLIRNIDRAELDAFALHTDANSYALYLAGQGSLASLDLREVRSGRRYLQRSVKLAPRFAAGVSAVARSYQLEWILTARGDQDLLDRSEHFARNAISADPYEARGHRELGFCLLYTKQFDLSIQKYETAEQLNPKYADLLADYADALVHAGHLKDALDKIQTAIELNPLCQDTYFWTLGAAHLFLGNYADAIVALNRMSDISPVYRLLAAAYALNGNKEAASKCRIKAMETYPDMTVRGWLEIVSFRDQRQVQHYFEGLKAAGFS